MLLAALLAGSSSAMANMRPAPEITAVSVDKNNPDFVYIRLSDLNITSALSTDGGAVFRPVTNELVLGDLTTNLNTGSRQYIRVGSTELFRSDDAGKTWTNTSAARFVREQINREIERQKERFWERYGKRIPERSALWHPLFAITGLAYCSIILLSQRKTGGWLPAVRNVMSGLTVLGFVWGFLLIVHHSLSWMVHTQWPGAFWSTHAAANPSAKAGLVMAIAASPLPLIAYLTVLLWILPGFAEAFAALGGSRMQSRKNLPLRIAICAASIFFMFHVALIFGGSFWE